MLEYRFLTKGTCTGDVTGTTYRRVVGTVVSAPEGEFKRLGGGDVEIVKKKKRKVKPVVKEMPEDG